MKNRIAFLKRIDFLKGLDPRHLHAVAKITKSRFYQKESVVFTEARQGDRLYVVASGMIKIFARDSRGKTKTLSYLERGDFFGEMALLDEKTRSASAQAEKDTELLVITRKDFKKLLRIHPSLNLSIMRILPARLRRADEEIKALSFQDVLGRVALMLLNLAAKHGRRVSEGIRIDVELTQTDIASLVGTAREMVNRVLSRMMKIGCIKHDGTSFIVTDKAKLRGWIT